MYTRAMSQNPPSAFDFPEVDLGNGLKLKMRWNFGTLFRLKKEGVDVDALMQTLRGLPENPTLFQLPVPEICSVIAAMASTAKNQMTGEEIADLLTPENIDPVLKAMTEGFSRAARPAVN